MLTIITALLEKEIGLSVESVGSEMIANAVRRHKEDRGLTGDEKYMDYLTSSEEAWEELIERVVVPETWFLRDQNSFDFLGQLARSEWLPELKGRVLRALSVPCSTGEEPYSIAMVLLDAGFPPGSFRIDAMDISRKALEKARRGLYGQTSFRREDLSFRDRYFNPVSGNFEVCSSIRSTVRFLQGNVLDEKSLAIEAHHDIIFCRNLLIYLTPSARERTTRMLDRLLAKNGVLFIGHSEHRVFSDHGFEKVRKQGVFACRRARDARNPKPDPIPPLPSFRSPGFQRIAPRQTSPPKIPPAVAPAAPVCGPPPSIDLEPSQQDREDPFDSIRRLADQGVLSEAFELCGKFLEQNPLHVEAHFLMGLICRALRNETQAEQCFSKVVYLDPHHHEALDYLAQIEDCRGNGSRAAQLRRRALKIRDKAKDNHEG